MSSLLYYSISSNLTEDEIIEVDRRIAKDREAVYLFFRELPSNSKRKAKRLFVYVIFTFQLGQPLIPFTTAVMMPLPPAIERLSPFEQDRILGNKNYYPQIVTIIEQKIDKMVLTDEQIDDLNRICYKLQTGSITLDKAILEVRGGSLIDTAAALVLIIVMLKTMGVGIDGFQIPIVPQNGGVHRPANGGIQQQQINHPKHGGRITLKMSESNQCPAHQTQTEGFVKNGKVNLRKCYDEVNRRASKIGCTNFECSFERFEALAMENGKVTSTTAREAITILQGEMNGYYSNVVREDYGNGIYGPDFKVIGQGKYSHITHVEVKNPVGSDIEKASRKGYSDLVKQGNKIGNKLSKQQVKWSNATFRESLSNLNPNAVFPQSPANTLGLVDEFDIPISEKMIVQNAIENNCTNTSSVIFINNETNI